MSDQLQKEKSQSPKCGEKHSRSVSEGTVDYKQTFRKSVPCDKDLTDKCELPTHLEINTADIINLLPTKYWKSYMDDEKDKDTEDECSAEQANLAINQAFITRLEELENTAPNAFEAKFDTYKDWVSVLQRLNLMLLRDFDEFEKTIEGHLKDCKPRSNCNLLRDIANLVQIIRLAFHKNKWSLAGLNFETVTPAYVMGLDEGNPKDMKTLDKLLKGEYQTLKDENSVPKKLPNTDISVKALVEEVAGKHDEINKIKQQLCCLEEEVQNAQKKIQLKDDVIRELRVDLKNLNKFVVNDTKAFCEMAPIPDGMEGKEVAVKSPRVSNKLIKRINTTDPNVLVENLEYLRKQLKEILATAGWRSSKNEAERLQQIFLKLEAEKIDACTRLRQMKDHLLDMLTLDQDDVQNLTLNDNDEMLIRILRDHIDSINLSHKELSEQIEHFLMEKAETAGKMEALNNINRINCEALKELADLLSSLTNESLNYNEIYSTNERYNPFCEAICKINNNFSKTIEDLTAQLATEKEKYRKHEIEMGLLEQKNDGISNTKLSRISYTTRTIQSTSSQHSYTTVLPIQLRHDPKSTEGPQ